MPQVGVCLSGGGWRAMSSACALFDALSYPLDRSETASRADGLKLLDTVSHAIGLSGGSWHLFTTLLGGAAINPFHQRVDAPEPLPHPWLHGKGNCFDENLHLYHGLAHMVSLKVVDAACHREVTEQIVGIATAKAGADSTILRVIQEARLGPTVVERWSNFIANDILNFADLRSGGHEAESVCSSRNASLGALREPIESGQLPFVVCSAIANRDNKDPKTGRSYDWVEFTPWFSRNPPRRIVCNSTDALCGHFNASSSSPHPLKVHHLMGICGSAFACDLSCVMPKAAAEFIPKEVEVSTEPLLGTGVTEIVFTDATSRQCSFGTCRDAGIDFNVPFPPMLGEAGRSFDVIIAHDAGAGSDSAAELSRAVELGYLSLVAGGPDPNGKFAPSSVRVFRSAVAGVPTIIYFLGLTERKTIEISQARSALRADAARLRNKVVDELIPVLLSELRFAQARLAGANPIRGPTTPHPPVKVIRHTHPTPPDEPDESVAATLVGSLSNVIAESFHHEGSLEAQLSTAALAGLAKALDH